MKQRGTVTHTIMNFWKGSLPLFAVLLAIQCSLVVAQFKPPKPPSPDFKQDNSDNPFPGMSPDDVIKTMCKTMVSAQEEAKHRKNFTCDPDLECIDWRDQGKVTPVRDQGQCGSCWAFGATGALESQELMLRNTSEIRSPQELVDCSKIQGNTGCNGGNPTKAYEYMMTNGLEPDPYYPYQAIDMPMCNASNSAPKIKPTDYVAVGPACDEAALKCALMTQGPMVVAVDATNNWVKYKGGVLEDKTCSSTKVNHAVLLVGCGITSDGVKYWIIKNSWGTKWGEGGYMKLKREAGNMCSIACHATYPVLS